MENELTPDYRETLSEWVALGYRVLERGEKIRIGDKALCRDGDFHECYYMMIGKTVAEAGAVAVITRKSKI